MDGIRKFSKEWFTLNKTNDQQIEDIKGLEAGTTKKPYGSSAINGTIFEGTFDEVQAKIDDMRSKITYMPPPTYMNAQTYGAENIFKALDADNDGTVTAEEVQNVAALSTKPGEEEDTYLSTDDLNLLYENAMDAVGSSFEEDGDITNITYADGSTSELKFGENKELLRTTTSKINEDGSKDVLTYNYADNSKITSAYNADGNLVSKNEDYEGELKDKTTTYEYGDGRSKVKTVDTIGKTEVTSYDETGRYTDKQTTVKYDSDGKIGNTSQESIGDCWVLAGVNALSYSSKGQEIISNAIQKNDDGSVTVNLVGGGKSYTFSAEEIVQNQYGDGSKEYSSGDTDMNLLEMAISQYRKENLENNESSIFALDRAHNKSVETTEEDPLNNGMTDEAVYLLTGTDAQYWIDPRIVNADGLGEKLLDKFQKDSDKYALVCSFKADDADIKEGKIVDNHVYSIKSVDEDNVYVVNPWDSSKTITYPRDEFMENVNDLSLTDLEEATTAETLDCDKTHNKIMSTISENVLGPADSFLRPKVETVIDEGKELYNDGKEFVEDKIDKVKDFWGWLKKQF